MKKFIILKDNQYCICLDNIINFYIASGHDSPFILRINFDVKDKVIQIPCKSKDEARDMFNQLVKSLNN